MQEIQQILVRSLSQEDPLEKEMATHSSILAWKIPRIEEPGGLQSTGSQRVDMTEHTGVHAGASSGLYIIQWQSFWLSILIQVLDSYAKTQSCAPGAPGRKKDTWRCYTQCDNENSQTCRGYEEEGMVNSVWGNLPESDLWVGLQRWMESARWASGRWRIPGGRRIYTIKAQTQKKQTVTYGTRGREGGRCKL